MAWRMIVRAVGGPEVIEREDFDPGQPGEGELLIANEAIGLNFIIPTIAPAFMMPHCR
jgi:NADPH:quinone reductase